MGLLDAVWHLSNLFGPALGVGLLSALLAKAAWYRELKSVPLMRLCAWAVAASALALLGGLIVFGRDGKMLTYAAMVPACAVALWWAGFGPRRS